MRKYAIIVAGGKGVRMGHDTPKQFLPLEGKPIIAHTIERFLSIPDIEIIITLPEQHFDRWNQIKNDFLADANIKAIEGGQTRFHSVLNGLNSIDSDGIVAIHDGVRPLISTEIISSSFEQAQTHDSAVTSVSLKDSIREVDGSKNESRDRSKYRAIQTPQTFKVQLLKEAFKQDYRDTFTDDASVFEAAGHSIHLIEGSYKNIKITTTEDLNFASSFIKQST